jgi:anthranilate synthase/aminodeoxychorismate synthase-like glutamine amidotransferase
MILLLDHEDSFVHTLAGYLAQLGANTQVVRDDAITLAEVQALAPAGIVLSPGPCTPYDCPLALEVVRQLGATTPILGVCLGHQVIAAALGATVDRTAPQHGRTSVITHDGLGVFSGLPSPLSATRYHSLGVVPGTLPPDLIETAHSEDGVIMGIRHREWPVEGVQFHPESVLTEHGMGMVGSWLRSINDNPRPDGPRL